MVVLYLNQEMYSYMTNCNFSNLLKNLKLLMIIGHLSDLSFLADSKWSLNQTVIIMKEQAGDIWWFHVCTEKSFNIEKMFPQWSLIVHDDNGQTIYSIFILYFILS